MNILIVSDILIVPNILIVSVVIMKIAPRIRIFIEMVTSIMRPSMVMKRLDWSLLVIGNLFAAVTVKTAMSFFAVIITQWMDFFLMKMRLMGAVMVILVVIL